MKTPKALEPSEAQFQQAVIEYLELNGWMTYHTHDSRHSAAGFPDVVAIRVHFTHAEMLVAELKKRGGKMTPEQEKWLRSFALVGHPEHPVSAYLWTPDDWPEIQKVAGRR